MSDVISEMSQRMRGVDPKRIVLISDYDKTMADKDPNDFDRTPFKLENHRVLAALSPQIAHTVVLTARGHDSVMRYLTENGPIQNLSVASNSGHAWHRDIALSPNDKPVMIPIPGYGKGELETVIKAMHQIADGMHSVYPTMTKDLREVCSAFVYTLKGPKDSPEHAAVHVLAEDLRKGFGADIAQRIVFAKLSQEVPDEKGGIKTQGYIDFKPEGMSKEWLTLKLPELLGSKFPEDPFIIASGDSEPDYAIMKAAAQLVTNPKKDLVCISVGEGLVKYDTEKLLTYVLKQNGTSAVDTHFKLLETIGANEAPSRDLVREAQRASAGGHPNRRYATGG